MEFNRDFENLPPDLIIKIALTLDIGEILSLCLTSKRFNTVVCQNKYYWFQRLYQDYDIDNSNIPNNQTPKQYYQEVTEDLNTNPTATLRYAVKYNNMKLAKLAVDRGADVNSNRAIRGYPIKQAIVNGNLDMVKYLMLKGVDFRIHHDTQIAIAAREGHLDILQYLVSFGSYPDQRRKERAIEDATKNGHTEIVEYLRSLD